MFYKFFILTLNFLKQFKVSSRFLQNVSVPLIFGRFVWKSFFLEVANFYLKKFAEVLIKPPSSDRTSLAEKKAYAPTSRPPNIYGLRQIFVFSGLGL
jgi:hypothetical protein